jgi:iron(III) transport system substrate-binding protein
LTSILRLVAVLAAALVTTACSGGDDPGGTLSIYTSVTQGTVDAVVDGFRAEHPDVEVEVFRAPTGELTARIAAEQRGAGIQAAILWLTDPLSMQQYQDDGLLREWEPAELAAVPEEYRGEAYWGTRLLNMVVVHGEEVPAPVSWLDLTSPEYADGLAIPDPGFAGSALGALGYFALADGYGFEFYEALAANGAVQVASPGDVVAGVAEGRFLAGMTLEFSARDAIEKGSPIAIARPDPGAVAIFSPIAAVADSGDEAEAELFIDYVLSAEGQALIAGTGWQPIRVDVAWEGGVAAVTPDWVEVVGRRDDLLAAYRDIFGG